MSEDKKYKSSKDKELEVAKEQFDAFDQQLKDLNLNNLHSAPLREEEQQTKMSSRELADFPEMRLKPLRSIGAREKFNERFRGDWEFMKELVPFIAENKMLPGLVIECWTKSFPGVPCEYWEVPVNRPIWAPRYLAERIKQCSHHVFSMQEKSINQDGHGSYVGQMVVDNKVQRLDAAPVSHRKSIFMGASGF